MFNIQKKNWVVIAASTAFSCVAGVTAHAQDAFANAVIATHPVAYYRLDATTGKSLAGASTYKPVGGVTIQTPGAPTGNAVNHALSLNGKDGYIVTTQAGGVGETASIMAWVNLAALPAKENRIFYVAGESQSGNDLDLQFEPDNVLRFFTASGGNLGYTPPVAALVNQWHMIVATLDTATQSRAIYWDGKPVAADKGGGRAGKTSVFTIGESIVFTGRFFKGAMAETALWNRALKASEVAAIYVATIPGGGSTTVPAAGAAGGGPFATTAKVSAEDSSGPIQLKREEQIALMFLTAMENIERTCQLSAKHFCTLDQVLSGSGTGSSGRGEHLKFDPRVDPNYTYTLAASATAWEAHATAKKPGLRSFCFMGRGVGLGVTTYNANGAAGYTDRDILGRGIEGDSFATQ